MGIPEWVILGIFAWWLGWVLYHNANPDLLAHRDALFEWDGPADEPFAVIKAPTPIDTIDTSARPTIFLAGSIDMGKAINWQMEIESALADTNVVVYNPRRDDWDSSWVQSIDNPQFYEQVTWELEALEAADYVIFFFDPSGPAPITLLELGLHIARGPDEIIVCCPNGYWRKGNVDIVCERFDVPVVTSLPELISELREKLDYDFYFEAEAA